mmetsp:Transcript_11912/g.20093  ORF Transcript_11912/g.20093 Transcript_11912/m.20093 type:complete len:438 (+) Transcript_11912:113-1426(+)|eukprot:CAMPEP_0119305894 /NCGR_PEP_ID=MMETSP1333-20130426/6777_1 /TAXON_ID=418940 /ORGANISM="Scyphosphaera apsteinii, Strain RCC1455" /LENGTH=437 /DNA_ID=CAMNT_0007309085 /DNA_START=112 /DNA_END=1425 /DNA_ORIENTATION=+
MAEEQDHNDGSDPDEAVISLARGRYSQPYHPKDAQVYKLCMLGASATGKSAIANRLVAHTFDPVWRPTPTVQQMFWRYFDEELGHDLLVELEDTPGLKTGDAGQAALGDASQAALQVLLEPLVWFEKRKGQRIESSAGEAAPLLGSAHGAKQHGKRKRQSFFASLEDLSSFLSGDFLAGEVRRGRGATNPIACERKRMGFLVVADVSSKASFDAALFIIEQIFLRLQFDLSDNIFCPAAILLVGNKLDLRGDKRDPSLGDEESIRQMVEHRFENVDVGITNVRYLECSARANIGLENILLTSLRLLRSSVPTRTQIRASRLRDRGWCGQTKRWLYTTAPFFFLLEDALKAFWKRTATTRLRWYNCVTFLWAFFFGLNGVVPVAFRGIGRALNELVSFRWVCSWCPKFLRSLRVERKEETVGPEAHPSTNQPVDVKVT